MQEKNRDYSVITRRSSDASYESSNEASKKTDPHCPASSEDRLLGPATKAATMKSMVGVRFQDPLGRGLSGVQTAMQSSVPFESDCTGDIDNLSTSQSGVSRPSPQLASPSSSSDQIGNPATSGAIDYNLDAIQECDATHYELDTAGHCAQVEFLKGVRKAVENRECAEHFASLREKDLLNVLDAEDARQGSEQLPSFDTLGLTASAVPGQTFDKSRFGSLQNINHRGQWLACDRTANDKNISRSASKEELAYTAWCTDPIPKGGGAEATVSSGDAIDESRCEQGLYNIYSGYGYGGGVQKRAKGICAPKAYYDTAGAVENVTGKARRRLSRESRMMGFEDQSDPMYLAFEAFKDPLAVNSTVMTQAQYSAVDTGTSVTVARCKDACMESFDPKSAIKIMGFNATVTRSLGAGVLVGFARTRQGQRVELRVPGAHVVPGAPTDLISVSNLVAIGYSFHFTPSGAYVVTPSGALVDLVAKAGLYWLKWEIAVDPRSRRNVKELSSTRLKGIDVDSADSNGAIVDEAVDVLNSVEDGRQMFSPDSYVPCCNHVCASCNAAIKYAKEQAVPLSLLHERFGHFNTDTLEKMVKNKAIDIVLSDHKVCTCEVCRANKLTRRHVADSREAESTVEKPFQRVFSDVKGKVISDFWGNQYIVTFTCELTRWTCVYFCKQKSQVKDRLQEFLQWVRLQGHAVSEINTDGGGEYTASENATMMSEFQRICETNNIRQRFTSPDTPAQNGIAERLNRTLVEHAAALMHGAGLAREFWSLAVKHVVWLKNRFWSRSLQGAAGPGMSPFQALYGRPPRVSMARVWGCDAWRLDTSHKSGTFNPKGKKGIFVGLSANRKGWVIFDPKSRTIRTTFHCSFDESFEGRRCALRDFDLRQRKAGSGSTDDDERLARLERQLYDISVDMPFSDDFEMQRATALRRTDHVCATRDVPLAVSDLRGAPGSQTQFQSPTQVPVPRVRLKASESVPNDEADSMRLDPPVVSGVNQQRKAYIGPMQSHNGGRIGGVQPPIPRRVAAIGRKQHLTDEDTEFLEFAFSNDLPMNMVQRNPKLSGSQSRARYERYKSAHTLRDVKRLGGSWSDIIWDFCRGLIDFNISGFASLDDFLDCRRKEKLPVEAASRVDHCLHMLYDGHLSGLTLEESIQQDFAVLAVEHLESLSHRTQQLLQRAIGGKTLVQYAHCCASRIMIPEPLTVREAMASEHASEWRAAMQEEIDNLVRFQCFKMVPRSEALQHGRLVKSKWVFKVKYNSDNTVQRYRARLVAKGFTQVPGTDYFETYSPVFSYTSLRTILAIAADKDLQLTQWDLKNSFIQQRIDVEHMYMECPDGYDKFLPDGSPAALHCLQSIYGLKQSSRLLHERLSQFLISKGFKQLVSDKCVYTKGTGAHQLIVCTWVDDIILASPRDDEAARSLFDSDLRSVFEVSPWTSGEAQWLLNMKITRDWTTGTLKLSQPGAIEKLAAHFKLTGREGRAPWVPMNPTVSFCKPAPDKIVPSSVWDYQSAVGGLLYLSLTARPDVAQAVGVLSRYMSCPGEEQVAAAKQVIKYLYATKDYGITYTRKLAGAPHLFMHVRKNRTAVEDESGDSRIVVSYADADLAGDVDTRKSTTGFGALLCGGLICWTSKLQSTVALSTAEAETNAGVEAVKQLMHIRLFLQELDQIQDSPSVVFEDNNAAIALAHGKEQSKRSRHYQIKVAFLSEQQRNGIFSYVKVGTKEQLGDAFTKALPREDFVRYREWMGVLPPDDSAVHAESVGE